MFLLLPKEQEANNYKCVTFSPVLKNHAFLYSLVNLFQFFNMWFIGINPLFIFLQSMKLIFKRTLKYKACQSQQGQMEKYVLFCSMQLLLPYSEPSALFTCNINQNTTIVSSDLMPRVVKFTLKLVKSPLWNKLSAEQAIFRYTNFVKHS